MQQLLKWAAFVLLFTATLPTHGQGCSDAGFCTMGAMKPDQPFEQRRVRLLSVEVSQYLADVVDGKTVLAYTADLNVGIGERSVVQVKLPYQHAYGPLGNFGGLSDISLSYTYTLVNKESLQLNATLGTKIPTSDANRKDAEGRSLPMFYQSSLGSVDLIFGTSLMTRNWLFAAGYQQALTRNGSQFAWGAWQQTGDAQYIRTYPASIELLRGIDLMFRVERNFRFWNFNFSAGLLPIYRITKDEITSPQTGERISVDGSQGLALSSVFSFGYRFSVRSGVRLIYGHRLRDRKKNPDGLYRVRLLTVGYEYRF